MTVDVGATATNAMPVANAGSAQSILVGTTVTLDGSGSSDANGDLLTYSWTLTDKPDGSVASLSDPSSAQPSFVADYAGIYVASLVVHNSYFSSNAATVAITASVANAAPVANAGVAQNVTTGATVMLNGSGSSDANGDSLTYTWTLTGKPDGSAASLSDPSSAQPTFVADYAGSYVANLVVHDGSLSSQTATVTITASMANAAPVANAGLAQNVTTGTTVVLDGSGSSDANGDLLTYTWALTGKPAGSAASLSDPSSAQPTFVADYAGTYVVSLVVHDGFISSQAASVTVTANVANSAPVANAGSAQNVTTGTTVVLDGSGSSDANGDFLSYTWTLTGKPAGSAASLSDPLSAQPRFVADYVGTYVARLIVHDGFVSSQAATVTITASVANAAPVANAGPAQSAYFGEVIELDGSGSSDADGDALTYAWSVISHPGFFAPTLTGANTSQPSFRARDAGTYVLSLVVSDGLASSASSTVTVTVVEGVAPTPVGSGLVVQETLNFWTLDEPSMTKKVDFSCGQGLDSIDIRPDGVIVGVALSQFLEVNPVSGVCSAPSSTGAILRAIAVSAQGTMLAVSFTQHVNPSGGVGHRLYTLNSSGASPSHVYVSGASNYVTAIDFGPDGNLYGVGLTSGGGWSVVRIDPTTGANSEVFALPVAPTLGDIDIDASGVLRTVINGSLYKFDLATGTLLSTTQIPEFPLGNSFAPIVFVP